MSGGKDTLPPLVHLRWDSYLTLLDTCGDLSGVRKADVISPGSWSGDSCPFPMQPIWWGSGDVPPKGQLPTDGPWPLRNKVEGQFSSGGIWQAEGGLVTC